MLPTRALFLCPRLDYHRYYFIGKFPSRLRILASEDQAKYFAWWVTLWDSKTFSVSSSWTSPLTDAVKTANLTAIKARFLCHTSSHITEGDNLQSVEILQEQVANQKQQINVKDNQIERLQSALNQSQQLQALTESRYQAEQQQLAEMLSRFGSATPTSSVCGWLTVVIT